MSGKHQARSTITALAAQGYEGVPLRFNADSDWGSLTWLTVLGDDSPETAGAIAKTVRRVDPAAMRVYENV